MSEDRFVHMGGHALSTKTETVHTHIGSDDTQFRYVPEQELLEWLVSHDEDLSTVVEWLGCMKEWVPAQTGDIQANMLMLGDRLTTLENKPIPVKAEPTQVKSDPVISDADVKAVVKYLGDKHDELSATVTSRLESVVQDTHEAYDIVRERLAKHSSTWSDYAIFKHNLNVSIAFLYVLMAIMIGYLGYTAYVQFH